jgi:5'-3' exonuclease
MITALIDGDWILYAAGFAGQRTEMVCPALFGDEKFKNMTEIRERADDKNLSPTLMYSRNVLDPEEHFYHSAKSMIETNCMKVAERFDEDVTPRVIIDGDGNFRSRLATIRQYKGQRGVHAKPLMFNNIRSYLLDVWKAEVVFDQESDDEMAIIQTDLTSAGEKCIIVGVDKDMLQVPGWHLNPNKGFKKISEREGVERLYVQAIQGDSVDNIAGAYKFGPAAARKAITAEMTEKEMWEKAIDCYQISIDKYGNKYGGLTATEAALENMRLVYLRRVRDELWNGPRG